MRYRLRSLLIVVALLPLVLSLGWSEYAKYRERERQRQAEKRLLDELQKMAKPNRYPKPPYW